MNTQASSGLGPHLTPKAHSVSCLRGDWPLTRRGKHREQPCSPFGPRHRGTLEPSEGWRLKDGIGGKDTHWSSVFNFLLHLPLAQPSLRSIPFPSRPHRRLWDTWPRSCVWFGRAFCFPACFSCLLCDLPSPKAPAKSIHLPQHQWAQVFPTACTCRAL